MTVDIHGHDQRLSYHGSWSKMIINLPAGGLVAEYPGWIFIIIPLHHPVMGADLHDHNHGDHVHQPVDLLPSTLAEYEAALPDLPRERVLAIFRWARWSCRSSTWSPRWSLIIQMIAASWSPREVETAKEGRLGLARELRRQLVAGEQVDDHDHLVVDVVFQSWLRWSFDEDLHSDFADQHGIHHQMKRLQTIWHSFPPGRACGCWRREKT